MHQASCAVQTCAMPQWTRLLVQFASTLKSTKKLRKAGTDRFDSSAKLMHITNKNKTAHNSPFVKTFFKTCFFIFVYMNWYLCICVCFIWIGDQIHMQQFVKTKMDLNFPAKWQRVYWKWWFCRISESLPAKETISCYKVVTSRKPRYKRLNLTNVWSRCVGL